MLDWTNAWSNLNTVMVVISFRKENNGKSMTENKYKSIRIADGEPRKVIVGENGKIVDRNPNKEE